MSAGDGGFVSRGGIKLAHALDEFRVDVSGLVCADFGCSTGGFTDCLLQRGAMKVYAIDTGYGVLDYRLRVDDRVVVMERTNALHAPVPVRESDGVTDAGSPEEEGAIDLITIDLGWTRQKHAIPVALKWVKHDGRIITLVKPHYELESDEKRTRLKEGRLDPVDAEHVLDRVMESMPGLGVEIVAHTQSPITGAKSSRKSGGGNVEYLLLLRRK